MKVTVIFVETRNPAEKQLDKYLHVILSSPHKWEPSKVKITHLWKQSLEEMIADIRQDVGI